MRMPLATKFLAATVLFGTSSAASFAQDFSRDTDEYGFRRTTSAADADGQVATVYNDFGYSNRSNSQSDSTAQEVNQLRNEVRHLTGLCADLYDQVQTPPDQQDIQFVSMMSRLDAQGGCFEESSSCCVPAPAPCAEPGCCDTCCCQPCGHCYGGFEAIFIKPHVKDDVAAIVDPAPDDNIVHTFNRNWEFTPRVWLGYSGADGLGVRATYWQLDSDSGPLAFVGTPTNSPIYVQVIGASTGIGRNAYADIGETFIAGSSIQLNTLDGEVTKEWKRAQGSTMLGFGLRFADMDQRFQATVFDNVGALSEQVIHTHGFVGFGPTVSINGLQNFGQSNWGVYGRARASVLFGERSQDIYEVKNGGADIGHDTYEGDELLTIGELGFGLQYSHALNQTYSSFIRVGYEGQVWFDAGGPTSTSGDLGLHGLMVGFGIDG